MEKQQPPPYNPYPDPAYQHQPPYPQQSHYPQQPQYPQATHIQVGSAQPPIHVTMQQPQPQTIVVTNPTVVVTGNCPGCRRGVLNHSFTCCGWCLAIFCFPIGVLFCFLLSEKRCSHCGGTF